MNQSLENSHRLVGNGLLSVPGSARHFEQTSNCSDKTQFSKGEINQQCDHTRLTKSHLRSETNNKTDTARIEKGAQISTDTVFTALLFLLLGLL